MGRQAPEVSDWRPIGPGYQSGDHGCPCWCAPGRIHRRSLCGLVWPAGILRTRGDAQVGAAACTVAGMAIARFPGLVIDCPDPAALANFYGAMLDWKIELSPGWADIRAEYGQCISFQQVEGYTPPRWPDQEVPQQMHLDVIVDDLDAAEAAVLDLGATKHEHQPGKSFRVFLDPAGHPFCLCID